ncbi:MAG: methyltransferase RsmF C-terminal domain-like protein [Runella sp.]
MPLLPAPFLKEIQRQLGDELSLFEQSLEQSPPVSIRLNPFKKVTLDFLTESAVAWQKEAFYLENRPVFTLDPLFHAGAYYVQEASSMLIGEALAQTCDLTRPLRVLDLCAAPGGKTTLLASIIDSNSLLLANEVIKSRVAILKENVQKWGCAYVHVSNHDPEDFNELKGFFDVVLVDAPCSGEGLFRKDPDAIEEWSEENVQLCSLRQQRILTAAMPLLRANGILVYCTCTYNDTENQQSLALLQSNIAWQEVKLDFPSDWGIVAKNTGYQCYPHRTQGEGFFMAVFRKKQADEPTIFKNFRGFRSLKPLGKKEIEQVKYWLDSSEGFEFFVKPNGEIVALLSTQIEDLRILDHTLSAKGLGLNMGTFKGKDFIPSHELALSVHLSPSLRRIELDRTQALAFLKKENFDIEAPKGWLLATYKGQGLGWLKNLGHRTNNYLPKDWRIRMEILQ